RAGWCCGQYSATRERVGDAGLSPRASPLAVPWGWLRRSGCRDSDRERIAAAAGRSRVRVLDLERGAHQILDKIYLGAVQEVERDVVDNDRDVVAREDEIVRVSLVVKAQPVLKPEIGRAHV